MTIQEAIKSGKPFRRKSDVKKYGWKDWYVNHKPRIMNCYRLNYSYWLHESIMEDILATDWEIKK